MILAGRHINYGMAATNDVIKAMLKRKQSIDGARVLVMGFTFKENVPKHDRSPELGEFGELPDTGYGYIETEGAHQSGRGRKAGRQVCRKA